MLLQSSNKYFKCITYIKQDLGRITFCNYIVTTISFFVITIRYVNIVLTPTVSIGLAFISRLTMDFGAEYLIGHLGYPQAGRSPCTPTYQPQPQTDDSSRQSGTM